MYFDRELPQPSTHAVSKPIDICRAAVNANYHTNMRVPNHQYNNGNSIEKQRPVNRVKPVVIHTPTMNSISSNSSTSSINTHHRSQQQSEKPIMRIQEADETSNKENYNRMPMIYNTYNIYENPSPNRMPVDALTRTLFNYIAVSPSCSCIDYIGEEDERLADESDILMPTEFRSIGEIIGYSNVIKSQRQETMDRFSSTMNQFARTLMLNRDTSTQMQ